MWDEEDRQRHSHLLEAIGMAQAADEELDIESLALNLGSSRSGVKVDLQQLSATGLFLQGPEEGDSPILLTAGRQFLARRGDIDREVLSFLPHVIDDLNTRSALLVAGTTLVDRFRGALLNGRAVEHAQDLVPPAFVEAVDERLALDLYAAAVALIARLSDGAPAGCVAEEILSVALMDEARVWLDIRHDDREIGEDEKQAAADELRGLFEFFEDDDVLNLFDMAEPADAALAGHDPVNQQLGVADQRTEAWFNAFGGTSPTGYLRDRRRGE